MTFLWASFLAPGQDVGGGGRQSWGKWGEWQHSHNSLEKAEQVRILEIRARGLVYCSSFLKKHNKQVNSPMCANCERAEKASWLLWPQFWIFQAVCEFVLTRQLFLFCLETVAENVRNMTKIIIKNVDTQPLTVLPWLEYANECLTNFMKLKEIDQMTNKWIQSATF